MRSTWHREAQLYGDNITISKNLGRNNYLLTFRHDSWPNNKLSEFTFKLFLKDANNCIWRFKLLFQFCCKVKECINSFGRNFLTRKIRATRMESAAAPRVATSGFESLAGEFDEVSSVESQKRIEAVLSQHFCFTCVLHVIECFQNSLVFHHIYQDCFEVRLVK